MYLPHNLFFFNQFSGWSLPSLKDLHLPPVHCAAMKKTAFNTETLPTAIIETVTAGFSCPPETCRTDIAKVAMLKPWLNAMWITEGGKLFHGKTVPQTMNRNKRVAKSSASTSIQNERDRYSVLPSWRNILVTLAASVVPRGLFVFWFVPAKLVAVKWQSYREIEIQNMFLRENEN